MCFCVSFSVVSEIFQLEFVPSQQRLRSIVITVIIIIINDIYIAQVCCKGHKCAMSTEMAVWLRNCLMSL